MGEKALITVTRSGKTDIASSVSYRVRSGTATVDEDFENETKPTFELFKGSKLS